MIVVDLNLLLYSINEDAPDHDRARKWWEGLVNGEQAVGLAWMVVVGFLRVSTHPRVLPRPIDHTVALSLVDEWLSRPQVQPIHPTARHWRILQELLKPLSVAGNLTSDAHLAALAIEHGASLHSADNDFARFPRLNWVNPLVEGLENKPS
ncbi:MAG: type II toxin-antitoxin system VapC family toxin [Myxococcota bacterium]